MKKLHMWQNLLIAVLAAATVFFALVSVLALIPVETDVEIREEIRVSSSLVDVDGGIYLVVFEGALRNTTSKTLVVERLMVPVDGSNRQIDAKTFTVEGITIPPRGTVTVSASETSMENCTKVGEVEALVDGNSLYLRNPAQIDPVSALIPAVITALLVFFLVRACKVRYYMAQEDKVDLETDVQTA